MHLLCKCPHPAEPTASSRLSNTRPGGLHIKDAPRVADVVSGEVVRKSELSSGGEQAQQNSLLPGSRRFETGDLHGVNK